MVSEVGFLRDSNLNTSIPNLLIRNSKFVCFLTASMRSHMREGVKHDIYYGSCSLRASMGSHMRESVKHDIHYSSFS
ncbi:hypothetical protein LguiA_030178 [Lonicera macranthoides]